MISPHLKQLADLEFGKAVSDLEKDKKQALRQALERSQHTSGRALAVLEVEVEHAGKMIHAYANIWIDLLERTNGGHLSRPDVEYVKQQLRGIVTTRKNNLMNVKGSNSLTPGHAGHLAREMAKILAEVCRDVEIRFQRQLLPTKKEPMANSIQVNISNAANVNLGTQVGTINAALSVIGNNGNLDVANALRDLSEETIRSKELDEQRRQEILDVITELARQAEAEPKARSMGVVKSLLTNFPVMIGIAADLTTLWTTYGPVLERFFGR
jgi:hypothetical protein